MNYDIVIVGGGMVGLTLACALAQKTSLSIAIIEAHEKKSNPQRVSAISLSSKRIFSALSVWESIKAQGLSDFTNIAVWDTINSSIQFDCRDIAEPLLGYIIQNDVIQNALEERLKAFPQVYVHSPVKLSGFIKNDNGVELTSVSGEKFHAKLIVAADGAHSWLREQSGIQVNKLDYDQQGIVATVKMANPHEKIARQVFLSSGPLAFLPLAEKNICSIVWSVPTARAQALLALDDMQFKQELASAFEYRLGEVIEVSSRFAFPLYQQQAERYIINRVALVGDAAHVMHPLAGQGVNTGLLDAARLAEVVSDACVQQRQIESVGTLRRYERWCRADNQLMLAGIDRIKNIFAKEATSARRLLSVGLSITDKMPLVKNIFMKHAVGNRVDLPAIAK